MLSTIVSNYNNSQYIEECINSILSQSYSDFEIIFVDDCSTDNSLDIINKFAEKDKRIRIISLPENHGAGYARNVGLENAKGEWISFVDSDDFIFPDFFKILVYRAEAYKCDIAVCNISYEKDITKHHNSFTSEIIETKEEMINGLISHKNLFLNNSIVKKKCFEDYGYCTRRYIEDTPTLANCLMHCDKECFIDYCGYFYRRNENSLTHTASSTKNAIFQAITMFEIYEIFKKYGFDCGIDPVDVAQEAVLLGKHGLLDINEVNKIPNEFNLLNKYVDKYWK